MEIHDATQRVATTVEECYDLYTRWYQMHVSIIRVKRIQCRPVFVGMLRSESQTADVPSCNAAESTLGRGIVYIGTYHLYPSLVN